MKLTCLWHLPPLALPPVCRLTQSFITIGNPVKFAILYSFGNIVSLCATMFLMGPCKQFKNMFDEKRRIATIVYLSALAATLVVAIWVRIPEFLTYSRRRTRPRTLLCAVQLSVVYTDGCADVFLLSREQKGKQLWPLVLILVFVQFLALIWCAPRLRRQPRPSGSCVGADSRY